MSKTITSTVKRFPGSVVLPDYLTFPQVAAWEKAMQEAGEHRDDSIQALPPVWSAAREIVQEWHIEGLDPARPPATPIKSALLLANWLIDAINALFEDEEIDPKA